MPARRCDENVLRGTFNNKWSLSRTFLYAQHVIIPLEYRLEFHDRRAAAHKAADATSEISPLFRVLAARGHVRDFSSRVILRGCAARVGNAGMNIGTQGATERLRLCMFSPRYIFLFYLLPAELAPFRSFSHFLSMHCCIAYTVGGVGRGRSFEACHIVTRDPRVLRVEMYLGA